MNINFKLQSFQSSENYLFDKSTRKYHVSFSSTEMYENDKGYDRFITKPDDYDIFGKIYLKAALERTIIQRKYMKITEFAANMSSILSAILLILFAGVRYLNMFFAEQSIIKRIFQFKDFYKNMKNEIVLNKMKDRFFFPLTNNNYVEKSNRSRNEEIASDNNMKDKTNLNNDCMYRFNFFYENKDK